MSPPACLESLLIVKLSSIGDVVQSLPVAAALRRRFPEAYLAWAVKPAAAEVVAGSPHLDETLVIGGREGRHGVSALPPLGRPRALARELRRRRFTVSVDMQGLLKSAFLAYLSGARERIGFRNWQEGAFLFNNRRVVRDRRDVHAVAAYLEFAAALDAPSEPLDFTIATTPEDRRAAAALVECRTNLIGLVPGARWLSKQWPVSSFAAVAETLGRELGATSVVVGAAGDGPAAADIAARARAPVLDLTGRTSLKQLAEVFRRCRVVVGNETGPMYIASAVGAPTVTIFGPTDPRRLGPWGEGHRKVWAAPRCGPCRRRACRPLRCMEAISVEQVVAAAREIVRPPLGANECPAVDRNRD